MEEDILELDWLKDFDLMYTNHNPAFWLQADLCQAKPESLS